MPPSLCIESVSYGKVWRMLACPWILQLLLSWASLVTTCLPLWECSGSSAFAPKRPAKGWLLLHMPTSERLFIPLAPPGGRLSGISCVTHHQWIFLLPSSPQLLSLETLSATRDSVPGTGTLASEVTLTPTACPSLVGPSRGQGMSIFGGTFIRHLIVWESLPGSLQAMSDAPSPVTPGATELCCLEPGRCPAKNVSIIRCGGQWAHYHVPGISSHSKRPLDITTHRS